MPSLPHPFSACDDAILWDLDIVGVCTSIRNTNVNYRNDALDQQQMAIIRHRICGDSLRHMMPYIDSFRDTFATRLLDVPGCEECEWDEELSANENNFVIKMDKALFRLWAIIDATTARTTRLGSGPRTIRHAPPKASSVRKALWKIIQQAFYSGYAKAHGLKALTIATPNGLVAAVFVCAVTASSRLLQIVLLFCSRA